MLYVSICESPYLNFVNTKRNYYYMDSYLHGEKVITMLQTYILTILPWHHLC